VLPMRNMVEQETSCGKVRKYTKNFYTFLQFFTLFYSFLHFFTVFYTFTT
jgi:hypothetical protein